MASTQQTADNHSTPQHEDDSIPPAVREVLALFKAHPELRFPDVDEEVLSRLCAQVGESAADVRQAQSALDAARETHAARQEGLLATAKRAFAYVRVYAESNPALEKVLADLQLAGATRTPAAKRPRRSHKAPTATTHDVAQEQANELPFETSSPGPLLS